MALVFLLVCGGDALVLIVIFCEYLSILAQRIDTKFMEVILAEDK